MNLPNTFVLQRANMLACGLCGSIIVDSIRTAQIMGTAYYIVLETEIDGLDTMIDGKCLARHIESLDSVARQLGLRPLTEFLSMDAGVLADILGDEAGSMETPPLQQFSAHDGLATIRALLSRPEAQPALQDLKDCERILSVTAEHGAGWHFQIDV